MKTSWGSVIVVCVTLIVALFVFDHAMTEHVAQERRNSVEERVSRFMRYCEKDEGVVLPVQISIDMIELHCEGGSRRIHQPAS